MMDDLRSADVDFLTIGQYLQPTRKHAAVERFVTPEEFQTLETIAKAKGFLVVASPADALVLSRGRGFRAPQGGPARRRTAEWPMPSFSITRRVPFTPRQMFDLVADVEKYPQFLPLCEALTVKQRERGEGGTEIRVSQMTVGYMAIQRDLHHAGVVLDAAKLAVLARVVPGASGPFDRLENRWTFREAVGGCDVDFQHRLRAEVAHTADAGGWAVPSRLPPLRRSVRNTAHASSTAARHDVPA